MRWKFWKRRRKKKAAPDQLDFSSIVAASLHTRNEVRYGEGLIEQGKIRVLFRGANTRDNRILLGKNFRARHLKITVSGHGNRIEIADNVTLTGQVMVVGKGRVVRIGEGTSARGITLLARDANVEIGRDCLLSREIEIRATDVHKIYDLESGEHVNPAGPVVIGDRVWIAARAFISKGARIPSGSVVGAMAFVNKAFEQENTIYAGVPAKAIRHGIRWKR